MNAEEQGFVSRIHDLATEAQTHLNAAVDAHDGTNDSGVAASHRALGGCLRAIERTFVSMGKAGMQADSDNNKKSGTSAGISAGTSSPPSPPRAGSPLLVGDIPGWLARASAASGRKRS